MAIAYRSHLKATGTGSPASVGAPSGLTEGDGIVLVLAAAQSWTGTLTITWPSGFTQRAINTADVSSGGDREVIAMATKIAGAGESGPFSVSFSGSTIGAWSLYAIAFDNGGAWADSDVANYWFDPFGNSTSLVIPSVTMPSSDGVIIVAADAWGGVPSLPAGMTSIDATGQRVAYQIITASGETGTRTTTYPSSSYAHAVIMGVEGALPPPPDVGAGGLSFNDGFYGPAPILFYGSVEEEAAVTLAASSIGVSTATGALAVAKPLAASAAGTSTATGGLVVTHSLDATANGTTTASGDLRVAHPLAATANGTSTATGGINVVHALAATANGVSTCTATLHRYRGFSATANGVMQGARYTAEILASGPVGYWKLNETSGTTAFDSSGSGINGTYVGSPTLGSAGALTADSDPAVTFNGTSQYVNLGNPTQLRITGNQTIEFWLRPTAFNARRNPWNKAYAGEGTITQEPSGTLNYYYGTDGTDGTTYQGFTMSGTLTLNVWQHVVLVRDLTAMKLRWYVNGILRNETNASYAAAVAGSQSALIGDGYVDPYLGGIDEVAVYNKALTAAEIERHYLAGLDDFANLIVAHTASGTSNGTATTTAQPNVVHPLAATANGTSTATGDLAVLRALAEESIGQSTATGQIIVHHTLAGTSAGQATVSSADLERYGPTEPPDYGVTEYGVLPYGGDLDDHFQGIAFGRSTASADLAVFFAVKPDGIPSEEAVGTPHAMHLVKPTGIASQESVGTPTVRAFNYILPEPIPSEEVVPAPSVQLIVKPAGIPSQEAVGTPRIDFTVAVEGGVDSAETFGQPTIQLYITAPPSIPSEEAVGIPERLDFTVYPSDIPSGETFGTVTSKLYALATPVPSGEVVSVPEVIGGIRLINVRPTPIPSAEVVSGPRMVLYLGATSVPSGEAVGTPSVIQGVRPAGIPSGEAVGTPTIQLRNRISPTGIPSAEAVSSPTVVEFELPAGLVAPLPIPSAEALGTPSILQTFPVQQIQPTGVPSEEAFGTLSLVGQEDWWSTRYLYRRRIEVLANSTESLPIGHGVDFTIPAMTIEQGKLRPDLGDLELVYPTDNGWVRLPRQASVVGDVIEVRFLLTGALQPAAIGEYYLYYGSPQSTGAGRPVFVDNPWPILVGASDERIDYTRPTEHWDFGVSDSRGARAAFEFAGTAVRLLSDIGPDWGVAEVQVDQGPWQKVDLYQEEAELAVEVFSLLGLDPEEHKIRIRATGHRDPQARRTAVNIKGFEYVAPYQVTVHGEEVDLSSWSVMTVVG